MQTDGLHTIVTSPLVYFFVVSFMVMRYNGEPRSFPTKLKSFVHNEFILNVTLAGCHFTLL